MNNMKRFELIKLYPGSPELGAVIEIEENSVPDFIRDFPEFWKKLNPVLLFTKGTNLVSYGWEEGENKKAIGLEKEYNAFLLLAERYNTDSKIFFEPKNKEFYTVYNGRRLYREELIKKEIILKAIEDFSKSIETPSTIYTPVYIVYKNGELITKYPKESKERHILLSVDRASYVLTHASDLVKLYFW